MTGGVRALLRRVNDHGHGYDALMFICPGCAEWGGSGVHMLPVAGDTAGRPIWEWDGNLDAPTLSPSILTRVGEGRVCHSFLRAGVFEFLGDSTHSLAGRQVPLPALHEWLVDLADTEEVHD